MTEMAKATRTGFTSVAARCMPVTSMAPMTRTRVSEASMRGWAGGFGPSLIVYHLVDCGRYRKDQCVVLSRGNLHAVGVPDPEPLLRDLGDPVPPGADPVLVVQDVSLDIHLRSVSHPDRPPVAERGDQGFFDRRRHTAASP